MDHFTLVVFCMSLVSFATLAYMLHRRKISTPATRLPPSPRKLPVIGHLHLVTDMPHQSFARLADQLGPIIYLKLGQVPTVVVSSARLAELILKTHDHVFSNRPQLVSAQYLSFGCSDVTFSQYGPYWRQARKICVTELLSPKRVSSFQVIRDEEVTRLVQAVSTRAGVEIDMSELFFRLANDMLCRVAFGKRFLRDESKEGKDLVGVLTETQALFAGFCLGDFYPEWEWVNAVSGSKRRMTKTLKELREVCEDIINDHIKNKEESAGNEDFVDVLLRVQRQHDLEVPITDDNLKALVLDMFVAGTDTTSATLEWTMTELARHPEVMKKAQDEIRGVANSKGEVEESDLHNFHYLKAVMKETMRLHPSVPLLVPRESMQSCTLQGYHIPFGGGRRGCPGFAFGLATIELALARLLYHFDWELPNGIGPDDVDLGEIFGLATRKNTALNLLPTKNTNYMIEKDGARVSPI